MLHFPFAIPLSTSKTLETSSPYCCPFKPFDDYDLQTIEIYLLIRPQNTMLYH